MTNYLNIEMIDLKKMTKLELKEWLQKNGYISPEGNKKEVLDYALEVYPQVIERQAEHQSRLHNYLSNTLVRTYGNKENQDTSWRRCQHTLLDILDDDL